jgi:hypothetical protein
MPTVLRHGPYSFIFFSSDRGEPLHIHVQRERSVAKFWLEPVALVTNRGFRPMRSAGSHDWLYNIKQLFLRRGMTTLVLETEPVAVHVTVTEDKLTVDLADGRSLVVPLAWYPRLVQGSPAERQHWQLLGDGYAIAWPALDEHIGVEGLLAGRRSGESPQSFARWVASRRPPR